MNPSKFAFLTGGAVTKIGDKDWYLASWTSTSDSCYILLLMIILMIKSLQIFLGRSAF